MTRARAARLGDGDHGETSIGISTDLRGRMDPQLDGKYMGNLALFSKGTLKVADITAEDR